MSGWHFLVEFAPQMGAAVSLALSLGASIHAILHKRDTRAAIGWAALAWLVPFFGPLLYALLGLNRIRRKAVALRRPGDVFSERRGPKAVGSPLSAGGYAGPEVQALADLATLVRRVTTRQLLPGNRIVPLVDGDQAYPAMLDAIGAAERTIGLCSYIFDYDRWGERFVDALVAAHDRGVEVRVLLDAVGARYSARATDRVLRRHGVRAARFIPVLIPRLAPYANLRNHRKILVVDGRVGFAGGMNIRQGHVVGENPPDPIRDVHFQLEGPVVAQLQEIFVEDWAFATNETLDGPEWFPPLPHAGDILARGIADGPDADFEKLRWALLGALGCARSTVRVVTPYFLPDATLVSALDIAALRGIDVRIVIPEQPNIPIVRWAMWPELAMLLERGCRIFLSPPPFDHAKLMVVDDYWTLLGSANWDPRSLRLNFELGVECYDTRFARRVGDLIDERMNRAREIHLEDVEERPLHVRLRDGVARLFSPYL